MKAVILTIQYKLCVFMWDKNSYNLFQLTAFYGRSFCNIKVKPTQHSAQKLFILLCFNFVCGYLPYTCSDEFVNCSLKKQYTIPNLIHLLAKQNDNLIYIYIYIYIYLDGSSTFCFEIPGDVLLQ